MTCGIWLGLLVALLVTSAYAINSSGIGSVITRYFPLSATGTTGHVARTSAVASVVMSALAALAVLGAWLAFARVTRVVVLALADASDVDSAATDLVVEKDDDSRTVVARTLASDVLVFIAVAWVVIIITPAILAVVQTYSAY